MEDGRTRFQFRVSTISLLTAVVALVISLFLLTARHNAQLMEMTQRHNAQLAEMTARCNAQLAAMAARRREELVRPGTHRSALEKDTDAIKDGAAPAGP